MKDNRIEKIKKHYTIILNGQNYKVLKHKIDTDKSLLTIKTKVFGQNFPHGENISFTTAEDNDSTSKAYFFSSSAHEPCGINLSGQPNLKSAPIVSPNPPETK